MIKFRVRLHPAGAILLIAAFLFVDSHLLLSAMLALAIHEGAHLLAMYLCGIRDCSIELTPFGGMADAFDFDMHAPWKQALSAMAGVLASGISAWLCWKEYPNSLFWQAFFRSSFSLALMNSLPAWPLDGARVLSAFAAYTGCDHIIKKIMKWFSWLLGAGIAGLGLYGTWHGIINPTLLLVGPYLCYASQAEHVYSQIRHIERINGKLHRQTLMPVSLWAGTPENGRKQFGVLLGRSQLGRYQVLLQVDNENGKIQKCWTENEMLAHLFAHEMEGTDAQKA